MIAMHPPHLSWHILAVALLGTACGTHASGLPDLKSFDRIITRNCLAAGYRDSVPLSFGVAEQDSTRVYWSEYEFRRTDVGDHYTSSITVAKGGTLLDPQAHEERYQKTKRDSADRGEQYLLSQFPDIGKRAHWDVLVAGPGGAAFGLTFTTSDGRYDVRIIVSNLLPAGVDEPDFDIDGTARRISALYDRSAGKPANPDS